MIYTLAYSNHKTDFHQVWRNKVILFVLPFMATFAIVLQQAAFASERPVSFAELAELKTPAVVNISTTTIVRDKRGMDLPQFPEGSPFEDFFQRIRRAWKITQSAVIRIRFHH